MLRPFVLLIALAVAPLTPTPAALVATLQTPAEAAAEKARALEKKGDVAGARDA